MGWPGYGIALKHEDLRACLVIDESAAFSHFHEISLRSPNCQTSSKF